MPRARNGGRRWTAAQKRILRNGGTTVNIARRTGRTKSAVRAKASRMRVSLMPRD